MVFAAVVLLGLPVLLVYEFRDYVVYKFRDYLVDASITWQAASPERHGMDSAKLDALRDGLAARGTWALLIVRHDRIVYEWYRKNASAKKRHYTASLQKSLAGGMALLVALSDGRIDLDDPVSLYIPAWRDDPLRSQITIRQLATHTSGIEDANKPGMSKKELKGWKRRFWRRDSNPFSIVLEHARPRFPPGTQFAYSSPGFAVLGYAITASLRGAPAQDIRSLLRERIMEPIGVPRSAWSMGYKTEYELDGLRLQPIWGGGNYTARAVARIGQLMLNRGRWNGEPLVDPPLAESVVTYAGTPLPDRTLDPYHPASTVGWWTNFDAVWPTVPRDAFAAAGSGHQVLLVIPSLDLVVVRFGNYLDAKLGEGRTEGFWTPIERYLFQPLMQTLTKIEPPYPRSPVIEKVSFDPPTSIIRRAIGSDNWPITWADDDLQYTAYGDGWGFKPHTDEKLSLGLAKISGGPRDFQGENVRSASAERTGDGPKGPKASGMLSVDGVLYMWVRNLGNAQLAWSDDHGKSWEWGFRFDTSFGSPTFLNFGRDYHGARDNFVYVYTQDGPSAYASDDAVVLARVARAHIRDRASYTFFAGIEASGQPRWTSNIEARMPVFRFPEHCARVDVVYNPEIRRYLMALAFDRQGGWGLFDAPEPWGPWTTAFFTPAWDLGRTHGYRLPSKWIARNGKELYAVISGKKDRSGVNYDAFAVRRLTLHLRTK
jgi:CubicO group peptidase (beta-lactamase class C family)